MLNTIVDLSHHNGNPDLAAAAQSGIDAMLHKATQGLSFIDPCHVANRDAGRAAGLLVGSFHFGTGDGDGTAQAQYFLTNARPLPHDLLALDFEHNNAGPSMTVEQARAFATEINALTGRWPLLCGGNALKVAVAAAPDPVLAKCPLWLAEYGPTARCPVGWDTWTLWQWTDGSVGVNPQPVAGIGHCDRNYFNGSRLELPTFWAGISA